MPLARFSQLRSRLIVAFLGMALVPLGCLVVITDRTMRQVLSDNAQRSLETAAHQTANRIDTLISLNLNTVRVEAILPGIVNYVSSPTPEEYATAIVTLTSLSRRDSINVLSYGLINHQGINILDTYTPYIGRNESQRDYVKQALSTGLPYLSPVVQSDRDPSIHEVHFASPIRGARGEFIGVLRLTYNATVIEQIINRQTNLAGQTSFAILVDDYGIRLANGHSSDFNFLPLFPLALSDIQALQRSRRPVINPGKSDSSVSISPVLRSAIQKAQAMTTSSALPELGSQMAMVSVAPLQNTRCMILVVQPEQVFLAPIHSQAQAVLILAVVIAGLVIILAVMTAQSLANPISDLTALLGTFNRRYTQQPLPSTQDALALNQDLIQQLQTYGQNLKLFRNPWQRFDELGILIHSFEEMAQQLQHSFGDLVAINEQLEERVQARTIDLKLASSEIEKLNQRLQAENLRMGAELEITRRLQKMILPRTEELQGIPELDIAGCMEPATEVGGDYYDVLQHNGRIRISIGDVTGHGLESGVLMIMVQMAVRTLLANDELDLRRFLGSLNRAIFANIQRMDSDKNLSLVLLDYYHGQVRVVGQHEELICRRHTGELQRIDTIDLGFPVGLEPDITAWIQQRELYLEPGDTLVLYTDGITEALGKNKQLYGIEQLCDIIVRQGDQSAHHLCEAIMQDVYKHIEGGRIDDDITLLVLKQR